MVSHPSGGTGVSHSPFSRESTAALDVPWVVFNGAKSEELGDLRRGHRVLHILLVGKDQN
jgi:hypothetical protein